ncbi:hypothetical protein TGDOM2_248800 [Toxoplasma gondii GAB2-2007-GAL-DOM2]|uniref:Uncharacterized protein n=2 Tax=Toxoplasma gondii TaxID=5811 RepID=A0A086LBY2_TOXGO|nr:hypothetical protein TGDOM2_248800 [Toxoplasma gondii GAB2-2007-GAL-DOM2]KFG54150.1 hypothetical protein TGFOU_248800 [Toxoplasma gondii FOU]
MRQTARGERRRRLPGEGGVHAPESASASHASSRVCPDMPTGRDRACASAGAPDGRDRGSGPARGDEKQKKQTKQRDGPQRETRHQPGKAANGDDEAESSHPAEDADARATGEPDAMREDLPGDSDRPREEDGRQQEETSFERREAAKEGEDDGASDVTQKMRELLLLMTTRGPAHSGGGKVRVFREILDFCKCLSVKEPPHPEGQAFLNRAFGFLTISKHWDASDEEKREICSAVEEHLFLFSKRQREQLQQTVSLFRRPLWPAHAPPPGSAASEPAIEAGALGDAQQPGRRESNGDESNYASSSAGAPSSASVSRSPFSSVFCSLCLPTTSVCSSLESSCGPSMRPFPTPLQCGTTQLSDPSSSFSSSPFFPASSSLPSSSACVSKGDAANPLQQTVNVNLFYSLADLPEQSALRRLLCERDQETATKLLERLPKPAIHFNCFFVYPEEGVASGQPYGDATSAASVTSSSAHAEEPQRSRKRSCFSAASSPSTASSTSFSASSLSTAAAVASSSFSVSSSASAFSSSTCASSPSVYSQPFSPSSSSPYSASASASSSVSTASRGAVADRSGVPAETEDPGGDTAGTGVSRQMFVASYSRREEARESLESSGHGRSQVYGQRRGLSRGSRKRSLSSSISSPSMADRPCSQLRRRGQKASWGGTRSSPSAVSLCHWRGSRHLQKAALPCRSLSLHPRSDTPPVFPGVNQANVRASVSPSSSVSSAFRVSSSPHVSACASPDFPVSSSSSLTIACASLFPPSSCSDCPSDPTRMAQPVVGEERPAAGTSNFRGSEMSVHGAAGCLQWPDLGAYTSYAAPPQTLVTPSSWLHSSFSANASDADSSRPGRAGGERRTDPNLVDPYMSSGEAEDGRRDRQPGSVDWNSVLCFPPAGSAGDAYSPLSQENSAGRALSVGDQGTTREASREERGSVAPRW